MDLEELMMLDPEEFGEKQFEELENHVVGKLEFMIELIKSRNYKAVDDHTFGSPAGDGYGMSNGVINFAYNGSVDEDDVKDICEVTERLENLYRRLNEK